MSQDTVKRFAVMYPAPGCAFAAIKDEVTNVWGKFVDGNICPETRRRSWTFEVPEAWYDDAVGAVLALGVPGLEIDHDV